MFLTLNWFIFQWDLVCSRGYLAGLSQTCFYIGSMIASVFASRLVDKYGRYDPYSFAAITEEKLVQRKRKKNTEVTIKHIANFKIGKQNFGVTQTDVSNSTFGY